MASGGVLVARVERGGVGPGDGELVPVEAREVERRAHPRVDGLVVGPLRVPGAVEDLVGEGLANRCK